MGGTPVAISNNGNTCFINALLQCILHLPGAEACAKTETSLNLFDRTLGRIVDKMAQVQAVVDNSDILDPLISEIYNCKPGQQGQNDPQECFQQCMHTAGHIESLFKFSTNEVHKCKSCYEDTSGRHTIDANYMKLLTYSDSNTAKTIKELILENVYGQVILGFCPEKHNQKNGNTCPNLKGAFRFEYFKDALPHFLCIMLPSVLKFSSRSRQTFKQARHFAPEYTMQLPEFSSGKPMKTVNYRLHSLLVHVGSHSSYGHYVAYVLKTQTNSWYRMVRSPPSRVFACS